MPSRDQSAEGAEPGQCPTGQEAHPEDGQEAHGPRDPVPEVGQVVPVTSHTTAIMTCALRLSFRLP